MSNTNIQQSEQNILRPIPPPPILVSDEFADKNILIPIPDDIIGTIKLSESPDSIYHYFVASPVFAGFGNLNSPERMLFLDNLSKVSPSLKNYLTSSDTTELIFSLGKEAGCDDSQISEIGILIRDLLTGKIFIKDFSITLASKLGIDDTRAGEIANKIISRSFGPIIEDVKRIQRSKFPEKIMQLQKEGRPEGLTQTRPPVQASSMPGPQQSPQAPRLDTRPPATEVKPLDSIQKSLEEELEKVASVIDLRGKP